jgi:signal transduction histidine kinase
LGTIVDTGVTELNEEQFRANRFELVSRMADDLAHEIKNPLNSIVINLEVLRAVVTRGNAEAALERAGVIDGEVRRLHQLIDRILQLLRPEREEAGVLALDQVLDELLPLVAAQVRLARNRFALECNAAVFVTVRRDMLKYALLNVIMAVHDRLGEGRGTLAIGCDTSDADVRIAVHPRWDEGPPGDLPAADGVADALRVARRLLMAAGGRADPAGEGAVVVLPRAAAG